MFKACFTLHTRVEQQQATATCRVISVNLISGLDIIHSIIQFMGLKQSATSLMNLNGINELHLRQIWHSREQYVYIYLVYIEYI